MKSVEILGPVLKNKGDELTLRSVAERIEPHYALSISTDLKIRGQENLPELLQLTSLPGKDEIGEIFHRRSLSKFLSVAKRGIFLSLLPPSVLRKIGYINSSHQVALLDCSGYAYGDKWSPNRMIKRAEYYKTLREKGIKLILMPQALGPFEDPEVRKHAKNLLELFDFVFPREAISENYILELGIDPAKIEICPDVTHLLEGPTPSNSEIWSKRVAVVPNARMQDKTDATIANQYIDFLVECIQTVRANDLEPVIILHEVNDDRLVKTLLSQLDKDIKVFNEDGIISKGFLGSCYANIGFRYHSLISSLSQATPSLASSWAHKYEELFDAYDCKEYLISPGLSSQEITDKINEFLAPEKNKQLRDKLQIHATRQKKEVENMWQRVESIIST
ncbi:polysaccharide pyruvyl transferase family protein [Rhodohalobacter sp. SW132]|uniref:polysaccharide pyruvyl transferase family protein n=1 Tax=Rhodohalobacter sp. SW132 TaxID=2293433 RepID=UPI000E23E663|nr:polysaccharide pyruvyl transferase family protein [Rhodohalobacter sp. SW132]REL24176.1 polysaccharide pyruvyl transferase family protein [Rhodohalobacter sp. SW132]